MVLDEQDRQLPLVAQPADEADELVDLLVVEAAGGLVEKEQSRPAGEGARELDPLQRPIRQAGGRALGVLDDPDVGERLERVTALLALPLQARRGMRADEDILEHGHPREELEVLEGARDPQPDHAARPDAPQRSAVEDDVARVEPVEAGDRVEGRRLAGAVGADQADDRPLRDLERDVVQRDDPPEAQPSVVQFKQPHSRWSRA